ncbi:hypothetical protein G7A66_02330 [Altererythrobacter sp. SALINAS58]|uniref:hypothetical protein n=1 Tax=Alteripontixanthobacter muriae TaxID=2705546 RepID=UPI00157539BC|nr:hypothetical protein [Alteripontixanthobacter muriae]NTZ41947.1 hypothetical protein [Alteripontixanthobacter muriae]
MNKVLLALLAMIAIIPLGGCTSFVSVFNFGGGAQQLATVRPIFGAADLEDGKANLRAGHIGSAIPQLQLAALNPDTAGEAFNALGVAYARLGRGDLAERFFNAAVMREPSSTRFTTNLDQFYASELGQRQLALSREQDEAERRLALIVPQTVAAEPWNKQVASERRGAIILERPTSRMLRQSQGTLALEGASEAGVMPTMQIGSRRLASVERDPNKRAAITILSRKQSFAEQRNNPAQASRIDIRSNVNGSSRRLTATRARAAYPIRVALRTARTN